MGHGQNQAFNFIPSSGYQILIVIVNGVEVGTPSSYSFSNVTSNQTIRVEFTPITKIWPGNAPVVTSVYPVPASDRISLKLKQLSDHDEPMNYCITDFSGRVLLLGDVKDLITSISLKNLSPGNYLLLLRNKSEFIKVLKISISR